MKKVFLALCCTLASSFAFAGDPVQGLGFDDLKSACQNPAKFHNQVAPTKIQVACSDITYKWVPESDGTFDLPTAHQVTTSVSSDKYSVAPGSYEIATSPQVLACSQYKQVSDKVDLVRAVTCEELIAFTGSASDFCSSAAASMASANKEAVVREDTGKTMSLCPGMAN